MTRSKKISVDKYEPSQIDIFRKSWLKKGYDLVNITPLCEFKLGVSGWCNDLNEPDDECYHIRVMYRDEIIANCTGDKIYPIDDFKYIVYLLEPDRMGRDFIIFRKVKL